MNADTTLSPRGPTEILYALQKYSLEYFFLNFYVSILHELELSLAQFLYPTYFKTSFDLGIK